MILRKSTQQKHHAAEQTPVGAAMAAGDISAQWWADWMGAILVVHCAIDPYMPDCLQRTLPLCRDLSELGVQPRHCPAAVHYVSTLQTAEQRQGAEYVFTGAHLMGGAVTHRALAGRLPAHHLEWDNRQDAVRAWKPLREREDLIGPAQRAFDCVLQICAQIEAHDQP